MVTPFLASAARFRSEGRRVVRMYPGTGDDTDFLDVFALADAPS